MGVAGRIGWFVSSTLSRLSDEQPTLASMNARGVLFFGMEREMHEQREKLGSICCLGHSRDSTAHLCGDYNS